MIIGIDPSVASTGISNGVRHEIIAIPVGDEWDDSFRRIDAQMDAIFGFLEDGPKTFYVEGPMLRVTRGVRGASTDAIGHLFDMGMWFRAFHDMSKKHGWHVVYVSPSSLKKFIGDKGNLQKQRVLLHAFKKWGIEIDNDPGLDKLHAYALVKYGEAVERGEYEHVPYSRRGKGKESRAATARKNRNTEAEI